jgi:3-deoxy-manno-octulosonate cytidylyltransferase (CMP-KDO synthetase)
MPEFIAVIPARYASTRLPAKALADIEGAPMVVHVARRAQESGAREVWIATDHDDIASAATAHGFNAKMTSSSHASGTDRIAEVAKDWDPDTIVVNVQGDEPLISPSLILDVARALADDPDIQMATACCPIADWADMKNPNIVKVVMDEKGRALYFSRGEIPYARDASRSEPVPEGLACRHIGIYAYRAGFLETYSALPPAPIERHEALEQLRLLWHGYKIGVIRADVPHAGVDTLEDLERVRHFFRGEKS